MTSRLCLLFALTLLLGCGQSGGGSYKTADAAAEAPAVAPSVERKIIYDAYLSLVVSDFDTFEKAIPTLIKRYGGYLADGSVNLAAGAYRRGSWTIRAPNDKYEALLDEVSELGVPEERRVTAQDVTEEFVDLEAHIANKQRLEERMVKLLEERSGKLSDVIELERELARVRGEIEQMQDRLRYLDNRTTLATVTIVAREERNYTPPQAPTFVGRAGETWAASLSLFVELLQNLLLALIFLTPWLLTLAVVLAILFSAIRWIVLRNRRSA